MKTKFFVKNKDGKIEFTEYELKKLLDEIYNEGYADGKSHNYVYTTPYPFYRTPLYTTTAGTSIDIDTSLPTTTTAINVGETIVDRAPFKTNIKGDK